MVRPDPPELRQRLGATVAGVCVRTARREPAAFRRGDQVRRPPRDRAEPAEPDALALELRECPQQSLGVWVLGTVEELLRPRLLDELARVHDGDIISGLGNDAHVVGDDDHPHLVLTTEVLEQVEDLRLNGHVEGRGRLVGDQQLRVARDCDRDHHALPHPAREPVRVVVESLGRPRNLHLFKELDGTLSRIVLRVAEMSIEHLGDLRLDPQRRVQRRHRILEDHRHLPAPDVLELPLGQRRQIAPLEGHRALDDAGRGLRDQTHQRQRGHRFPTARLAHDPERLPCFDREADAVDGLDDALTREEVRVQVVDVEKRH